MEKSIAKKYLIIFIHMSIGWMLCGATIGIGRSITSMDNTIIIHVLAVPIFFSVISYIYFTKFHYTRPFITALVFMLFAMFMDAAIVAPVFEKSYEMFTSVIGTWVPFALIFMSTFVTGTLGTSLRSR
jgi:hypothetical protein